MQLSYGFIRFVKLEDAIAAKHAADAAQAQNPTLQCFFLRVYCAI